MEENNQNSRLEFLVSVGPPPQKLKDEVRESEIREIIFYCRKVYVVRWNELRNLGLNYHDEIVDLCREKGLANPVFFSRACMYCNNSTTNLADLLELSNKPLVLETMPKTNCTYRPKIDIKVASPFISKNKKQEPFYAVPVKRCVFDDSLISYLADNGLLNSYQVDYEFNFLPISSFRLDSKIPEEFFVKNVYKKLGLRFITEEKRSIWKRFLSIFR